MIDRGIDGAVEARMDAYRGNPQMLQQKYAQNQELIDLLALQKLKSEKEAAARDMQLKMAQQQAAQGQPPTIKDQREQEVMQMTKQELAQQMGGIAKQQQAQQQQKMQQLMQSGVASLPAPGIAKMAGGGIVAFAGEDGSYVEDIVEKETRELERGLRKDYSPEAKQAMASQRDRRKQQEADYLRREQEKMLAGGRGAARTAMVGREPPIDGFPVDKRPAFEAAPAQPRPPLTSTPEDRSALNQADSALRAQPATTPPVMPQGIAGAMPKPPGGAVPGTLATPTTPPLSAETQGLGSLVSSTASEMMRRDPRREALAEEARVEGRLRLTPEQRAMLEGNAEQMRRLYAEEMDPEARRRRELQQFLIGAGGRTSLGSIMAGGATAAENERRRGFRESVKGTELVQKKLEDIIGMDRGAVKEGIGAGQKAFEQESIGKREGLAQGRAQYGAELESRDKALQRQIQKMQVEAQERATLAAQDRTNFERTEATIASINARINDVVKMYMNSPQYGKKIAELQGQLQFAPPEKTKQLKEQIDALQKEMEALIARDQAAFIRRRNMLENSSTRTGAGEFKVEKISQ